MNNNFIKRIVCPICSCKEKFILKSLSYSDSKVFIFLQTYYSGRVPKLVVEDVNYVIAKCIGCGLIYQENILNDQNMFQLYENWILSEDSFKKKQGPIEMYTGYAREIVNISKIFKKPPHEIDVLEFGMGWGFWLRLANAYNFNVTGVELSKSRIDNANKSGLHIIKSIDQADKKYDYIYANQVFEHLSEPLNTLINLKKVLKPNGVIYLQFPSSRGIEKKLNSNNWNACKDALQPLEHINCFTKRSIKKLALEAGLHLSISNLKPIFTKRGGLIGPLIKIFRNLLYTSEIVLINKK